MRAYQVVVLLLLSVAAAVSGSVPSHASWPTGVEKDASRNLKFVRQFSSSQDVKRELHPDVNRAIDIIAGPKDAQPATDALQEPYSVTTDSTHRVFITDVGAGAVHVFDFVHSKYSLLRGGDALRSPFGIAADGEGDVYVSDSSLQTILVYDSRGKFVHYLKKPEGGESYFDAPRGIAVDPTTEHIYVCDTSRHMVIMLDKRGRVLSRFGKRFGGKGPGEFRYPTQIVVAGDEIVVMDSGNSRVEILDRRGHFRKEIRLAFASNRAGLAMDSDRNIYVTDPQLNRMQVFNHDGQLLYGFGGAGTGAGQFNGMSGIWVDSGHCLYVVDTQNKRVQLFQIAGANAGECE